MTPVSNFLTFKEMEKMKFELDIYEWELGRTHWAVKKVDLMKELANWGKPVDSEEPRDMSIDLREQVFDVSLSFPGEARAYVRQVASSLEKLIGKDRYFYDENYRAQLAAPSLDLLLQDIYGKQSKLIVVFIGKKYQEKNWCGVEFKAIREILKKEDNDKIMYIKMDDGPVEGVFETDGYIDARKFSPEQIAGFILERTLKSHST